MGGILLINEFQGSDYTAIKGPTVGGGASAASDAPIGAERTSATSAGRDGGGQNVQDKTVSDWEGDQAEFAHLPPLPPGWLRIKSRSSGQTYFFNKRTQQATFDMPEFPLPEGWTKQVSKSTGKTYYFN